MYRYLFRRLLNYLVLLFIAVSLAYLLAGTALNPRTQFDFTNPNLDVDSVNAMLTAYNINPDIPLLERYSTWLQGVLFHWDWGRTPKGDFVNSILATRIWVSVRLITIGSFVGIIGGVALGAWTATRQYKISDRVVSLLALLVLPPPTILHPPHQLDLAVPFPPASGAGSASPWRGSACRSPRRPRGPGWSARPGTRARSALPNRL